MLWAAPALLCASVVLAAQPGQSETPVKTPASIAGTASVIDADTLEIKGQRIRLVGVDAPESDQKCLDAGKKFIRCGANAANALDKWIARNPVSCAVEGKDRYQRFLAKCSVRGSDVQEWLVVNGHAMAYRSYSTAYVPAELKARQAKAGIWGGQFIQPWDWRQGLRLAGEKPTKAMLSGKFSAN